MKGLRFVYISTFLFSLHLALLSYLNSSVLETFVSERLISLCYAAGSVLSLVGIFLAPRAVHRLGIVRFTVIGLLVCASALWGIASTQDGILAVTLLVLYFSLVTVLVYSFDLLVEHYSKNTTTGGTRGIYLTINGIAWAAMPVVVGILVGAYSYAFVYKLAAIVVGVVLIIIAISQRSYKEDSPRNDSAQSFKKLLSLPTLRRITAINFVLQFFFAWMVIYSPLYLLSRGFNWKDIGLIFTLMLLAFPLTEYGFGKLADRYGEKRFIQAALVLMGIATLLFGIYTGTSLISVAGILFLSRVGAAITEVCCDSYFFKNVSETDTGLIGIYRTMYPIAYIVGPIAALGILGMFNHRVLYVLLAVIIFLSALYSRRLTDTKVHALQK